MGALDEKFPRRIKLANPGSSHTQVTSAELTKTGNSPAPSSPILRNGHLDHALQNARITSQKLQTPLSISTAFDSYKSATRQFVNIWLRETRPLVFFHRPKALPKQVLVAYPPTIYKRNSAVKLCPAHNVL